MRTPHYLHSSECDSAGSIALSSSYMLGYLEGIVEVGLRMNTHSPKQIWNQVGNNELAWICNVCAGRG